MRFATVFALAGAAASVSASALLRRQDGMPPACALPCLQDETAPFGECGNLDNVCLCNNAPFVAHTTECVTNACQGEEREAAFAFSRGICEQVGVTLSSSPVPEETPAPEASGSADPVVPGSATTQGAPSSAAAPSSSSGSGRPTGSQSGSAGSPSGSNTPEPVDADGSASTVGVSFAAVAAMGLAALAL